MMKETQSIQPGDYLHKEGNLYTVIGMAAMEDNLLNNNRSEISYIGTALSVAGYEETGEVSGNQIHVFCIKSNAGTKLIFVNPFSHSTPESVVVYRQNVAGHYP